MLHRLPAALLACLAFAAPALLAENRYFVPDRTLPAGGSGELIELRVDTDVAVRAYAFAIHVDPAQLRLTAVSTTGTFSEGAEYLAGRLDGEAGLVGYGCVFAFSPQPEDILQPGTGHHLVDLVVDVVGAGGGSTQIAFAPVPLDDNPVRPPVENMLTNNDGFTVVPTLSPSTITIEDRSPRITAVAENTGQAGKVFQVTGSFFGEAGLDVMVCGAAASFTLEEDGQTLLVTAPECASLGWTALEVCTVRGCDTRAEGFEYVLPPEAEFVRGNTNGDSDVDLSDGVWILRFLFQGGPQALCYDSMDSNDDGNVDLSDAPYIFNFLFLGGPEIPPPYPLAGMDPTPDELPRCRA